MNNDELLERLAERIDEGWVTSEQVFEAQKEGTKALERLLDTADAYALSFDPNDHETWPTGYADRLTDFAKDLKDNN